MDSTPFNWTGYFKLAEELARRPDEASLRSAISRAYYYIYHLALTRAEANDFVALSGEATHSQSWRVFSHSPEPGCMKLAQIASRLKEKRERADYRPYYARLGEDVPEMLADAEEFAARLGRLHPRHPNPKSQRR